MIGISFRGMMAAAGSAGGAEVAEAIDFDGDNDYLLKSSDLAGNSDSKTFTFSCWQYIATSAGTDNYMYQTDISSSNNERFYIVSNAVGKIQIIGYNASATTELFAEITTELWSRDTWNHILISIDMANSGNRYVFINDVDVTSSVTWNNYVNATLYLTGTRHVVSASAFNANIGESGPQRLAHLFLDHTFRTLTTESERRKFITSDLKPVPEANLTALSPILYLPLTDPASPETNAGTGGAFTLTGTVARSGRGPNQDNLVASDFDGSSDYFYSTNAGLSVSSKTWIVSLFFKPTAGNTEYVLATQNDGAVNYFEIYWNGTIFKIRFTDGTTDRFSWENSAAGVEITAGANYYIQLSVDLADQATTRQVFINGVDFSSLGTWNRYSTPVDAAISMPAGFYVGRSFSSTYAVEGSIGEVYWDDAYIDLATDNPFWDANLNKPVSVRKVIDDTGVTPLVALPTIGNNAGNNLGTSGDFTVIGGPYTGARGGSEFWARSAKFNGTDGTLIRTGGSLVTSKTMTMVIHLGTPLSQSNRTPVFHWQDVSNQFQTRVGTLWNAFLWDSENGSGAVIVNCSGITVANEPTTILISVDMSDVNKRHVYVNGVDASPAWNTYVDDVLILGATKDTIGSIEGSSAWYDGDIGFYYLANAYTDFSDEAVRSLFVDQLGYPRDLAQAIADSDIAEPITYMRFDDVSNLGTNSGTGGDYTESGTVDPGADVNP